MTSCAGQLIVHRDGSVAYCTEEQEGHSCPGEDRPHRRGVLACRLAGANDCPYCAAVLSPTTPTL